MFANHTLMMKLIKDPAINTSAVQIPNAKVQPTLEQVIHPDSIKLIEEAGFRFVKRLCILVGVTVVVIKAADALGEIAVNASPKK